VWEDQEEEAEEGASSQQLRIEELRDSGIGELRTEQQKTKTESRISNNKCRNLKEEVHPPRAGMKLEARKQENTKEEISRRVR
jgi:hypothetical protein